VEHIQDVLRRLHDLQPGHPDDFVIRTQYDFIKKEEEKAEDLAVMMMLLMGISIFAAGVGVCNMLLFSVSERTKEIGLRMAVGARRWHIFVQFMVEAALISVLGGVAGTAVGVAGSQAIEAMIGWPIVVSMDSIIAPFLMALFAGLSSGLYPAHKATVLSPIEALRHE
jgi:putative ABC transport system permease protein